MKKVVVDKKSVEVYKFGSLSEYTRYLRDHQNKTPSKFNMYNDSEHIEFSGGDLKYSFDSAEKGNTIEIKKYLDKIDKVLNYRKLEVSTRMDVEGVAYDMGAVISGEPECCIQQLYTEPKKEFTLLYSYTVPWYFKKDQLYNMGIAALTLQNRLKEMNYVVNLKNVRYYNSHAERDRRLLTSIDINGEFNSTALMQATSHPTFFRTLSFMFNKINIECEQSGGDGVSYWNNYGDEKDQVPFCQLLGLDPYKTFYIPSAYDNKTWETESKTPEQAIKFVIGLFNKYAETELVKDDSGEY